ncbi:hypothetical protein GE09DRAFT_1215844 [Coniochaeta sp. 2T2.1]|nr:hypothetical protein GE09DRAFT_1215844 [Coniochaeta sp. 2T2.1]
MKLNAHISLLLSLFFLCHGEALPQDQGSGPVISPTVDSMTMTGSGCPLATGGIVREIRNNTPVFLSSEWGLDLAEAEPGATVVSKFCSEVIELGNGPLGYQVRIATISVGGWAELDSSTRLVIDVETKLAGVHTSSKNITIVSRNLVDNRFSIDFVTEPENWSPCVNETGKVPRIEIKTSVALIGTQLDGGLLSSGVVGGQKTDLKKALSLHFEPAWRLCETDRVRSDNLFRP